MVSAFAKSIRFYHGNTCSEMVSAFAKSIRFYYVYNLYDAPKSIDVFIFLSNRKVSLVISLVSVIM